MCSAESPIDRKAGDTKALFSRAIEQVASDGPGIVHIAAKTFPGNEVEVRRTEKEQH